MIRQKLLSIGAPVLAAAAMLFTAGPSFAQHHGGGGYHGGSYGGYHGGSYGGYYHGDYGGHYGYYPGHYGYYPGHYYGGWGGYYPGYGAYYSATPYYYNNYYYTQPYVYSAPPVTYQSFYPPPVVADDADASVHLNVQVPADATVWIDGRQTQQKGESREFVSPALAAGKDYSYEVKARWMKDGQPVERTEKVTFHAGERVNVNFLKPAG